MNEQPHALPLSEYKRRDSPALAVCGGAGGLAFYGAAEAASAPRGQSPPVNGAQSVPHAPAPVLRTIKVPSEVDGRLLGILTEINPDDKVADKDVVVVGKQKYRRLREGDTVKTGQLLARVNDVLALDELAIMEARTVAAEADLLTTVKTKEDAKSRLDGMAEAIKRVPNAYSQEDIRGAKLTYERYAQEVVAKQANVVVAQRQQNQARTQLKMYEIRSPVDGVVKTIHFRQGEAVKRLETVLEILPADDDK